MVMHMSPGARRRRLCLTYPVFLVDLTSIAAGLPVCRGVVLCYSFKACFDPMILRCQLDGNAYVPSDEDYDNGLDPALRSTQAQFCSVHEPEEVPLYLKTKKTQKLEEHVTFKSQTLATAPAQLQASTWVCADEWSIPVAGGRNEISTT
ncbi:hypothetical protein K503DRAFT_75684 [Rhizopogon vinicolor AM-OR11-026]|uniref:Uncharacterized protein n=1 Tax=Rhizopogon vinicolor AM-OR11-026 TaxID=1314800 RepID=A0A1B7N414_9AGAM|nr:hypothetical protein K503DRAFT_75684 [Rhizopogon vinicolor AM-OR11-026]